MPSVVVGPVIGKITDTTARILAETDGNAQLTCELTTETGQTFTETLPFPGRQPSAFRFQGLVAATTYDVRVTGAGAAETGRFRTFDATPSGMNLAAVSCNFTTQKEDTDLWRDLWDRYVSAGDVQVLLHLGDQVYCDAAFEEARAILKGKAKGTKKEEQEILELFRRLYRLTWGYPATRQVLAHVSNLMIWDDHEIRDDWGSRPSDWDRTSPDFYIGGLARQVFREYQRQLWDDNFTPVPSPGEFECHWHAWGPVGVLFIDQRTGRSFERDSMRPYLGIRQWDEIVHELTHGDGDLAGVRALVVSTSVPLIYLGDSISSAGDEIVDDLRDHWAFGSHGKEQIEMLRLLREWKAAGKGDRDLLVIGGDVHIGCETAVKHLNTVIFKQLITSPITHKPAGWFAFQALKALLESEQELGGNYGFEHSHYTRRRNYGIVVIRVPEPGQPPLIQGSLVRA